MRFLTDRKGLSFLVAATIGMAIVLLVTPNILSQSTAPSVTKDTATYRDIVKKVLPAVVSIETHAPANVSQAQWQKILPDESEWPMDLRRFFGSIAITSPEITRKGFGSGFIVDPKGVIVTNHHVVHGAKGVTVRLHDGRTFESKEIKSDPKSDLAIILIEAPSSLPAIEFADANTVEIGDRVLAFGSPFGLTGSVTSGIISGKGRHPNLTMYEDYLQTDAAINPGNSGGPLVNLDGRVVGVNTAMKSSNGGSQGVGFAIPSGFVRDIIGKLQKNGTVQRGYLGVQIRALDPVIAERLGNTQGQGVLVARVMEDSPAAQAGIQAGDLIASIDGQNIREPGELQRQIADRSPNKTVRLQVFRDGKSREVTVTLQDQPEHTVYHRDDADSGQVKSGERIHQLGFEIATVTDDLARRFGYQRERTEGVMVTRIDSKSLVAHAGITPGTIITKVDDTQVKNANEAREAFNKASLEKGILLQIHYPESGTGYVMVKANVSR